ncbi:TIGR04282 family arsenosugar biosynthesis glycosyltransferase [Gramella sp. KN1008]|uniref:TIGR04282 family arsenosugar biosynthesis glycosyltransferase n=1 Tax=Gramella sp. KN1008 TaxID=2529298 RepID=UPI00103D8DFC|nr:TIGR04282 family arsenosugar biosynthesis glycosyltransferase [Gramella sp. KN1008]TBW29911.1 glycosyltransferase [Gramella sp. KN1008]
MNKEDLLIIFTKNPIRGKVKTRLARDLGKDKALEVYKYLLAHSYEVTSPLPVTKHVYYSQEIGLNDRWDHGDFDKKLQKGADLGEKMKNAFQAGFEEGYKSIVIIGTDLYELRTEDIKKAFSYLKNHDYVIGPASDGGYYLLGMNSLNSGIFINKEWSTSSVFRDTLKDMEGSNIKLLRTQTDIDVLDDIKDHPDFHKFLN